MVYYANVWNNITTDIRYVIITVRTSVMDNVVGSIVSVLIENDILTRVQELLYIYRNSNLLF